jgi:hypothetical protein
MVGRDAFEAMDFLTGRPDLGVRCCNGDEAEREEAIRGLDGDVTVVLDLTAVFTVWRLDLTRLLAQQGRIRFALSQTTFDELRDIAEEFDTPRSRHHMHADGQGRYVWAELPEEQQRRLYESLQGLVTLVRDRCAVLPCRELADLEPEFRTRLTVLFGRDGAESICLAGRPGHVLWTDDMTAAAMARERPGVTNRAWTQVVLHSALSAGTIDQAAFEEASARLIGLGYSFTFCSPPIMVRAGLMAGWDCEAWPFCRVLDSLRLENVRPADRMALAAAFIVELFREVASPFTREAVVRAILTRFADRQAATVLRGLLSRFFGLDATGAVLAQQMITDWLTRPMLLLP